MVIRIADANTPQDGNWIESKQRSIISVRADDDLAFFSGIAVFNFRATTNDWIRELLEVEVNLGINQEWTIIRDIVASMGLNSISNEGGDSFGGVAVDTCTPEFVNNQILLRSDLAIRGTTSHLFRVNYHVNAIGTVRPPIS